MIIDFRLRPPFAGYVGSQTYSAQTIAWVNRVMCTSTPDGPGAALHGSMPAMIEEMDAAGIAIGVTPGRHRPGTEISNDVLLQLKTEYPDRFVPLASVDVVDTQRGIAMIDEAVGRQHFPGIALDLSVLGMRADDSCVYPIYEHCSRYGCCAVITLSALGARKLDLVDPADLDHAAGDFPRLNFVSAHGSYPYALQLIGVAMRRDNVWLAPDMYMTFAPGGGLYVEAAAGYLQDRMLFGSGYPYVPLGEAVERTMRLPISDAVREKLLYGNAKRLLKL
jgi:hypothetical protein